MRLADVIGRWIGRVEIALAGAEDDLREGEAALSAGDGIRARAAARRVLARAPDSPIGLALLADACEIASLDAELALTLEELARRAPSRAEVWVRLARARQATGAPPGETRDALLRALAVAESGSRERIDALLALADADLAEGDGARAELWLARVMADDPAVVVRRGEARLLQGDPAAAKALLDRVDWAPSDGRAALALGRARTGVGDVAAFVPLVRAMVLDVPGASAALSYALARLPSDAQTRTHIRSVVDARGEQHLARWRAAFARAEGSREAARRALRDALRGGDDDAARPLLDAALDDRDPEALADALRALGADTDPLLADARRIAAGLPLGAVADALDGVAPVSHPRANPWAAAIAQRVAVEWVPASGAAANWPPLLERLESHAYILGDRAAVGALGQLSADRSSPLALAIVGEFNAGKSTFINALLGAEVAPMGVLPTTATLHHLPWAPDSFAKILRVEVIDTPGFNAGVAEHESIARHALDEADIAVWLVDATQAIKQTERQVLDDATRLGLPVQVLVNKADRVAPEDLPRVVESVREGLAAMGLISWRPPCAFSAKKALAGRLGDEAAMRESGWPAVRAVLEEGMLTHADALKERALRRRAARLVAKLAAGYRARAAREEEEAVARATRARAAALTAARVEREAEAIAARLATALQPPAERWARDLAVAFVGRRDGAAASDPVLSRYRVDRAMALLAPPLANELASLAPAGAVTRAQVMAIARAVVRTAAEAPVDLGEVALALGGICRASIASLTEELFAFSAAAPPPAASGGTLRELEAFATALE